jgi:hypothetical protein
LFARRVSRRLVRWDAGPIRGAIQCPGIAH